MKEFTYMFLLLLCTYRGFSGILGVVAMLVIVIAPLVACTGTRYHTSLMT